MQDDTSNLIQELCEKTFLKKSYDIIPGIDYIPPSGKYLDPVDLQSLIQSCLDLYLTGGHFTKKFEQALSDFTGIKHSLMVNSGSSANLIAVSSLTSPILKERQLKPGDEVITVSAGFPTTVNPIFQNNLIPVFVDINLETLQINEERLTDAISKKTKAVFVAHTLGNPMNIEPISDFCKKNDLWFIEDCCDALGAQYKGNHVGIQADISTLSFYPAHHITTGEGGAVLTSNDQLKKILMSFRDWGRDCWCPPGKDNTCGKRFDWNFKNLPEGYDHKYIYSHIGYNLKATEMQAALGLSQLKKNELFYHKKKRKL